MNKIKFDLNLWRVIDIDRMNDLADKAIEKQAPDPDGEVACDLSFKFIKVTKDGKATIECRYEY